MENPGKERSGHFDYSRKKLVEKTGTFHVIILTKEEKFRVNDWSLSSTTQVMLEYC